MLFFSEPSLHVLSFNTSCSSPNHLQIQFLSCDKLIVNLPEIASMTSTNINGLTGDTRGILTVDTRGIPTVTQEAF